MTRRAAFKRIELHLARSKEFPSGSAHYGYELVAPLNAMGHIDPELWKRTRCNTGSAASGGGGERRGRPRAVTRKVDSGGSAPPLSFGSCGLLRHRILIPVARYPMACEVARLEDSPCQGQREQCEGRDDSRQDQYV